MTTSFILAQLSKLFRDQTILVLDKDLLEDLVLASVPNLRLEAEEETTDPIKASKLRKLADELDHIPASKRPQQLVNLSTFVN